MKLAVVLPREPYLPWFTRVLCENIVLDGFEVVMELDDADKPNGRFCVEKVDGSPPLEEIFCPSIVASFVSRGGQVSLVS